MKILDLNFTNTEYNKARYYSNVSEGIEPFLVKDILDKENILTSIIIYEDRSSLENSYRLLKLILPQYNILKLPAWNSNPYEDVSPDQNILNDRFVCFKQTENKKKKKIILCTINSLIKLVPKKNNLDVYSINFEENKKYNLDEILMEFYEIGYKRVDLVLEPNEIAIRGGVFDVWPIGKPTPFRLDFFGNKLESIKSFNPVSQLSKNNFNSLRVDQSLESPNSKKALQCFIKNSRNKFGPILTNNNFTPESLSENKPEGIEQYLPLFYNDELENIFSFFDAELIIAGSNILSLIEKKIEHINNIYNEKINDLDSGNEFNFQPLPPSSLYILPTTFKKTIAKVQTIFFSRFDLNISSKAINIFSSDNIDLVLKAEKKSNSENLLNVIKKKIGKKKLIITYTSENENKLIKSIIYENKNLNFNFKEFRPDMVFDKLDVIDVIKIDIVKGFETKLTKLISLKETFKTIDMPYSKKVRNNVIDMATLNKNDYVAHHEHGIAKYIGLKTIQIADNPHDCLVLEYLNRSLLYVPVENINLISRYSAGNSNVLLDKLGSSSWIRKKSNVKKKIRDLASSLLTIAAKRKITKIAKMNIDHEKLFSFAKQTGFNETDDQIATLNEVYNDFISGQLMDRLVCGDVGFGKTEIALRAAFVVNLNNKKTLILAPTTLLARQHYHTFKKRFSNICDVFLLNRATTKKEKDYILNCFKGKKSNILIATHSVFSQDLSKADIGLVVIDEEQHFGVAQKEKIKKIRENCHLLTLSATPIPRTLHMSLLGVKDLSLIKTPPVDRRSISTTVCNYDSGVIRRAINSENLRNGQTYVIVPRIKDITIYEEKIKKIYPQIKMEIAHGKLKSAEIEKVMDNFYSYKTELLLSTSIVESGLDIPRANTLIVFKANNFGLAQLHQLRGRIGRSNKKAFAYFLLEKNEITANAVRRLKALQAMDSIGAGIHLSNYDLDIRGAGNLLGEEQSGQINQVGVELYQRLLKECIDDLKNNKQIIVSSYVNINIKLPILIPEQYIPDLSIRMSLYRRLGEINSKDDMAEFQGELENRFGVIPKEFVNLLNLVLLKTVAAKANIKTINITKKKFSIFFDENYKNYTPEFVSWLSNSELEINIRSSHHIEVMHNYSEEEKQLLKVIHLVNKILSLNKL